MLASSICNMARSCIHAAVLGVSLLAMLPVAMAQNKPSLKILVGFPAGGSADTIARQIGNAMKDNFSSVTVENKPGAAGWHLAPKRPQKTHPNLPPSPALAHEPPWPTVDARLRLEIPAGGRQRLPVQHPCR